MICNTIGLTTDSFSSIYMTGGAEVEEVYGAINYGEPIYAKIREIAGIPPLYFTSRTAGSLTDYRISGETMQDGTPSPDYPVDVVGVGERTENLLNQDADGWERNYSVTQDGNTTYNGFFDASPYIEILPEKVYTLVDRNSGSGVYNAFYDTDKNFISSFGAYGQMLYTATSPPNAKYIRCSVMSLSRYPDGARRAMLIEGDTEPPAFIPYGYKLPVTVSNGTDTITTPVYIGNEPLHRIGEYADYVDFANRKIVRKIKKLVLTGEEPVYSVADSKHEAGTKVYGYAYSSLGMTDIIDYDKVMHDIMYPVFLCSHFIEKTEGRDSYYDIKSGKIGANSVGGGAHNLFLMFATNQYTTVADFKSYLAAQYAAGTPVTVWYVLAEPIEEDPPVPFPALPTLSGTNTMSVDTTVKSSQMYIKGKIKPDGYGKLVDKNGAYILDKNGVQLTVHGQTDTPNA